MDLQLPSGAELHAQLVSVLPDATLSVLEVQTLVDGYARASPVPRNQSTADLNDILRQFGMEIHRSNRAQVVIAQVLLLTWCDCSPLPSHDFISENFYFDFSFVETDTTLPLFVWYMRPALQLVKAKGHMDLLVQDVVVPLSERGSGKRYVPGGGSETVETAMRYFVFEKMSGCYRPKTARNLQVVGAVGKRSKSAENLAMLSSSYSTISVVRGSATSSRDSRDPSVAEETSK